MNDTNTLEPRSTDLKELQSLVHGIIGRKCWKVAFTYGGELTIHFGRQLAYRNPKMAGKKAGEWRLGTRATPWTLFTPHGLVSSKDRETENEKSVEEKLKVLVGRKVTRFNMSVPDHVLTIAFGDNYLFRVTPAGNNARSTLSYWKLLMPEHKLVLFGPGQGWSCRRSDMPVLQLP